MMRRSRPLTSGEIALARSLFGDAIDYPKVRLVKRKWWPFQPRNAAMAPTGNIHFHPHGDLWSEDFAAEPLGRQGLFIHEMTHVWQTQRRGRFYLPLMRHPFCRYRYEIKDGWRFERYGLEQQAEIVRHLFLGNAGITLPQTQDLLGLRSLTPFSPV
ncbi:vgr related protein [Sphingomonas sp.]|uniref:vgr related protein n=1 Tax=Sphingomonas sp. TaxID=28214 RepID=UPI00286BEBCE|nr:vgr related protein [Sphingomonas sp.]